MTRPFHLADQSRIRHRSFWAKLSRLVLLKRRIAPASCRATVDAFEDVVRSRRTASDFVPCDLRRAVAPRAIPQAEKPADQ